MIRTNRDSYYQREAIKIVLSVFIKRTVLPDGLCSKDIRHKCHIIRITVPKKLLRLIQGYWNKKAEET